MKSLSVDHIQHPEVTSTAKNLNDPAAIRLKVNNPLYCGNVKNKESQLKDSSPNTSRSFENNDSILLPLSTTPSGRKVLTLSTNKFTTTEGQDISYFVTISDGQIVLTPKSKDEIDIGVSDEESEDSETQPTIVELTYDD